MHQTPWHMGINSAISASQESSKERISAHSRRRVIVFIDDLDRCSEGSIMQVHVMALSRYYGPCYMSATASKSARLLEKGCCHPQVLEAINLVLATCRVTTVLGVATQMLYRAIRSHYSSTADKKTTEAPSAASEGAEPLGYIVPLDVKQARQYLQKIVQVSSDRLLP